MVPCLSLFSSEIAKASSTILLVASSLLDAFPVVTFVEMILLSVDNCFLIGSLTTPKSFPYNTGLFSVVHVTSTSFLSSTGAERHLKANGFVTSPDFFSTSIEFSFSSSSS